MTRPASRLLLTILLTATLFGAGCDSAPERAAEPAATGGETAAAGPKDVRRQSLPKLSVAILPEEPTAETALRARVSGAGGEAVQYRWEIEGSTAAEANGERLPAGGFGRGDLVAVTAVAGERTASARVTVVNTPPEVLDVGYSPPVVRHGTDLEIRPEGRDVDGDPISYRYTWFINGEEKPLADGPLLPGSSFAKGDRIAVEVVPADDAGEGPAFRTGEIRVDNAPPRFVTSPPTSFRSATYVYRPDAVDDDGDALTFRLETGPEGMEIDPGTGELRWPIGSDQAGQHRVRMAVSDGEQVDVQEFRLEIAIEEAR